MLRRELGYNNPACNLPYSIGVGMKIQLSNYHRNSYESSDNHLKVLYPVKYNSDSFAQRKSIAFLEAYSDN